MQLDPRKKRAIRQLVVIDYFTAMVAWLIFWAYRYHWLGKSSFFQAWEQLQIRDFVSTFILIPGGWLLLYLLSGTYFDLYRKSRLHEINRTLISCILGSVIVSLAVFANDSQDYSYFIKMTGRYLLIHTLCTLLARILMLNRVKQKIINGEVGF